MSLWGTAANRVFASANANTNVGKILFYDGLGWTQEPVPTVGWLNDIWATPTGEVFAVGDNGLIITGR